LSSQSLGRVVAHHRGRYAVATPTGGVPAVLAGRLRHGAAPGELPVVGDVVELDPGGVVVAVRPRGGVIRRLAAGTEAAPQVLAANVDLALVVTSLNRDLNARRVERFLALAADGGVAGAVILSKADLDPDPGAAVAAMTAVAGDSPVIAVSALTGFGMDRLKALLAPRTTAVLLGTSGAGKSTLVNALLGEDRQATTPVRVGDDRGRHTTARRELLELPGGAAIVDTPGLRLPRLWEGDAGAGGAFADLEELARRCRFADCRHQDEPGCAVRGVVDPERVRAHAKLERERAWVESRRDDRARRERKARGRAAQRAYRHVRGRR